MSFYEPRRFTREAPPTQAQRDECFRRIQEAPQRRRHSSRQEPSAEEGESLKPLLNSRITFSPSISTSQTTPTTSIPREAASDMVNSNDSERAENTALSPMETAAAANRRRRRALLIDQPSKVLGKQ